MKKNFLKSNLLIKLFLVLVFVSHACQQAEITDNEELVGIPPVEFDLAEIKKRGRLIALVDNTSTSFYIYKGRPMGFEFELLTKLGKKLGVELEVRQESDLDIAFHDLNAGKADILAYNLAVTKGRLKKVAFTGTHHETRQILIQRKPSNWRSMSAAQIDRELVRNVVELGNKKIHIRKGSSFKTRLQNLSTEIGSPIQIVEMGGEVGAEELIQMVAKGEIAMTVVDENDAKLLEGLYQDIDTKTPISFTQSIAWAVRHNAPELLAETNIWLKEVQKSSVYAALYNRYYKNSYNHAYRVRSSYSSIRGSMISPFDTEIQAYADLLGWDWRLLASQIYQESKFEIDVESWAGAQGLMQIMPATAERFGAEDPFDPMQSLRAGVNYLEYLDKFWINKIEDPNERLKFILASYNAGQGHVLDAYNLAFKYGKNPKKWENVEEFLLKKSDPEFYLDPIVRSGYCRGQEPVNYVKEILSRYEQYRQLFVS